MTRDAHKALNTREAVRGRLNVTGSKRRDAIERSRNRGELPSYTDDELEEITGKFAALSAHAAAQATANALAKHREVLPTEIASEPEPDTELAKAVGIAWKHRARIAAKVAGLIASGTGAFVAIGKWLGLF